ncbi:SLC13 family permease [Corynebacterium cystitidis]|uniref:SLC13 family permease n=1 Tax=Corynebacterium cystitidis TaxID=35757 RepID=UPI00211DEA71|nr:SLC13 family permease [Corynebacterium cystitidis]
MSIPTRYSTTPPPVYDISLTDDQQDQFLPALRWTPKLVIQIISAVAIVLFWLMPTSMEPEARTTLAVFAAAIWFWIFSSVPDTYVALVAVSAVVLLDIISVEAMFAPLGHDTTWLLIGAFILSTAITTSGLAHRAAVALTVGVSSPRALVHLLTFATVLTAFAVPATSGRAALILPVIITIASVVPAWLRRVLAIGLPSVVLFSAVATLIGAGAHLITNQVLAGNGFGEISFTRWIVLGFPYALIVSHLAAELIYLTFSTAEQRKEQISITRRKLTRDHPLSKRMQRSEVMALSILATAILLWFTENLHGIPPALVAILAALLASSPAIGITDFASAIKKVPWNLLLFMAATVALAQALTQSGAARALANMAFGNLPGWLYIIVVILVSTAAHLVIQSRSARSAVLIPIIIATAPAAGVNPVAAAFISTAAAGFCHTLPASAKPLTIFRGEDDNPRFNNQELLRASATLAPMFIVVTLLFTFFVWPTLGLPLSNS